ncbi:cobalamin biosynthesis protein CbiG [Roseivivax jejudonensis]|uniref:Cobalamin biosynthesis protein CbiG n=1 Tax=Roseivivax jejudonensis TaxID=1529041 RepID=A0A1X6ZM61_9RHOB|nr:cobalamin biosynthesis protein [Roseivivax jejudonensis]SLN55392.1 cobalamin biosynthesis protein CbiG [Roseivivax jejudonensis]
MAGPAVIVAGFGFRDTVSNESLSDALARALGDRPGESVAVFATAAEKATRLRRFAGAIPVRGIEQPALVAQDTRTRSAASIAAHGAGSVAEAAALAAAGPGSVLLGSRVVSGDRRATCALAQGRTT